MDKKPLIIHPLLFAVFPVLFLFAHNIGELEFSVAIIPLAFTLLFTLPLLFLTQLFLRNIQKTAALLSLALLTFFSYGPFSQLIEKFRLSIGKFIIGPEKFTFTAGGILLCSGAYFIIKTRKSLYDLTRVLNVVASSLVIFSLITIGMYQLTCQGVRRNSGGKIAQKTNETVLNNIARLPDIYYIILDAYGREDILKEIYGYDNSEFIGYLKRNGFYIAEKSRSNYSNTFLSLASSLNLSYLEPEDLLHVKKKFSNNRVFSIIKK